MLFTVACEGFGHDGVTIAHRFHRMWLTESEANALFDLCASGDWNSVRMSTYNQYEGVVVHREHIA